MYTSGSRVYNADLDKDGKEITGTLSGTASNANALTTGRAISTTGDVTYTSPTFNGTADVSAAATVNSVGGVFS